MKMLFGKGLDSVPFGISKDKVVKVLGSPTKLWSDEYGSTYYGYYRQKLILGFDTDFDDRLYKIEVLDKNITLDLVEDVWRKTKNELISSSYFFSGYELDSFNEKECLMFDGISFNFTLNQITRIELSVLFDDKDEPIFYESNGNNICN